MLRKCILTLYGGVVGIFYAARILWIADISGSIAAAVWIIVLAATFGFFGWLVARMPTRSNVLPAIIIPVMPLLLLSGLIGFVTILLLFVVMCPFLSLRHFLRETRHRNMLKSQGRFVTIEALRSRLDAGTGTLIEDTGHKGPYRIWWTEDDLFALGRPVAIAEKDEFIAALQGEHEFNSRCLEEYLDDITGKALLTSLPARYARKERLTQLFPRMKIAAVVRPVLAPKASDSP